MDPSEDGMTSHSGRSAGAPDCARTTTILRLARAWPRQPDEDVPGPDMACPEGDRRSGCGTVARPGDSRVPTVFP